MINLKDDFYYFIRATEPDSIDIGPIFPSTFLNCE